MGSSGCYPLLPVSSVFLRTKCYRAQQGGVDDETKYPKKSVSFPPDMLKSALARAKTSVKGTFAGYIQSLVARDLRNEPIDAMSDNIMESLTRRLCSERDEARIRPLLTGLDQRDELAELLKYYIADRSKKQKHAARF